MKRVAAIVLAAGRSSRMGQPKMLLPFGDTTVIGAVIGALRDSAVDEIVVVVREGDEALEAHLTENYAVAGLPTAPPSPTEGLPFRVVPNPDVDRGMLSSVRCGMEAVDAVTYCIALGDMPAIRGAQVDALLAVHERITIPVHHGKRGHPVLIDTMYREEILTQFDDVGLRGFMDAHRGEVKEVAIDGEGVLLDMDTPEEYERLRPIRASDYDAR